MKKRKRTFGQIWGFTFFFVSILYGATMLFPLLFAGLMESVAKSIWKDSNTGIVSFYISSMGVILPTMLYIYAIKKKSEIIKFSFILMLLSYIVFLNMAWLYSDWLKPSFRMDGQQGFRLVFFSIMTCWIYPILGLIHDEISTKHINLKSK